MTDDGIADAVVDVLREFVDKVRRRISRDVGGVFYHGANMHGVRSPHASFWLADGDDELILSVSIRRDSAGLQCDCDLGV